MSIEKSKKVAKNVVNSKYVKSVREQNKTLNFDRIPIGDQVVVLFPGQGAQFVGMGSKVGRAIFGFICRV